MARASILLTGATGAVGSDLLRRLAQRGGVTVNVVVRRTDKDPVDRVRALLQHAQIAADVNVVEGDIAVGASLAMRADARRRLERETTHIIHCAGSTSFTLPLAKARAANVDTSRTILEFARNCPALECGTFLSTVYVSGKR